MTRVTLVVSIAVWVVAVVVAWRSADHVIPANRPWTRAWRILVATVLAANLDGIWFPFGAAYIATRHYPARAERAMDVGSDSEDTGGRTRKEGL